MKEILILGGTGRLGHVLAEHLTHYRITTLARNERADIQADINDFADYGGYHTVVNCAAMKDVAKCEARVEDCIAVNINGVAASLKRAAEAGVKRYIYISTDMAVDVHSVYGAAKKIADALVVNMAARSSMECAVVRLGNIIGNYGSILTTMATKAQELGYAPVTNEAMTRFLMSIGQCADFVVSVIESPDRLTGDIFAPCCKSYRILDIAAAVAPEKPVKITGMRPGDVLSVTMISSAEMPRTTRTPWGHYRIKSPWSEACAEPIDLDGLQELTSANNPEFASVAELRELYQAVTKGI